MGKLETLRKLMAEKSIDYLILAPGSNSFYLTGFKEEQMERPLLLIVSHDDISFLAPKIYKEQIEALGYSGKFFSDGEDPYRELNLKGRVAIDDELRTSFTLDVLKRYDVKPEKASEIMLEIRKVKNEEEIRVMEEGVRIAEKSFEELINYIKEGVTERELSRRLQDIVIDNGAEGTSFEPIITFGSRTSMPHLRSGDKMLRKGENLVIDYGVKYKGYSTDTTRTLFFGKSSEEFRKVYEAVLEAQTEGEKVEQGVKASDVDARTRKVIEKKGYGEFFIHRTGHGIGIDVHEGPYISPDSQEILVNGECFTIEPGIYLPGKFGVRIEDMVHLSGRAIVFNLLDKELWEI
ncbi:peptidase M24 family protein [Sulfolobales archaeon HS-7]|nr:peptidase M24 family protein [Sulfolobales archaeon HS-7]